MARPVDDPPRFGDVYEWNHAGLDDHQKVMMIGPDIGRSRTWTGRYRCLYLGGHNNGHVDVWGLREPLWQRIDSVWYNGGTNE